MGGMGEGVGGHRVITRQVDPAAALIGRRDVVISGGFGVRGSCEVSKALTWRRSSN